MPVAAEEAWGLGRTGREAGKFEDADAVERWVCCHCVMCLESLGTVDHLKEASATLGGRHVDSSVGVGAVKHSL